ncbi:MAG: hypothetical protein J6Q20_01150 [Alistipes sp.]|nr:hypothetical protein [Alistipes sp.]
MKRLLKIFAIVVLTTTLLSSCSDDPDHLYGKKKPMRILDENGNVTTKAYVSTVSHTFLDIVGGVGYYHTIEVEDESLVDVLYSNRGAVNSFLPKYSETDPAGIAIKALKFGSTTISITDEDIDKTITIDVEVVNEYKAVTIKESNVEGLEKGAKLAFLNEEENEYRFIKKSGQGYVSLESGTYHFGDSADYSRLPLTLNNGNIESNWIITDADNNKNGYRHYISNILEGLNLPYSITTRFQPAIHFPQEFLFTDSANPERYFKTGPANTTIKYTFE